MLYFLCDENSEIPNLSNLIRQVIKTKKDLVARAVGQPSGDWYIYYKTYYTLDNEEDYLEFHVFNSFTHQGYKFIFSLEKLIIIPFNPIR